MALAHGYPEQWGHKTKWTGPILSRTQLAKVGQLVRKHPVNMTIFTLSKSSKLGMDPREALGAIDIPNFKKSSYCTIMIFFEKFNTYIPHPKNKFPFLASTVTLNLKKFIASQTIILHT